MDASKAREDACAPSQAVSVASGGPAEGRKAWMGVMAGLWRAAATMGGGGPLWGAVGPAGSMFGSNCYFLTSIQVFQEVVRWSGIPISISHSL